jgi:phosphoserine phosphatase
MDCILIRHGETAWNRDERFRGRVDIPLTEVGMAQADRVARALSAEPIVAIYSSPMQRALRTAAPLAGALGLPVTPHPALIDVDFGEWQGLSPAEVAARWPALHAAWLSAPHTVRFPGGDSLIEVRSRVEKMLDVLYACHRDQKIALVSHQAVTRVLMGLVLGLDASAYWRIVQDNACLNRFTRRDAGYVVVSLNETCHLSP